jgi:phosphoglycolate phosphatase-like HAD superfamily hydrolase
MDLTRFDAAIVDLDGTMVDTLDDFCVALNRMLGDLPAPFAASRVDRATIEKLVGKGSEHLLKSVLALVYRPICWSGSIPRLGKATSAITARSMVNTPAFSLALRAGCSICKRAA